MTRTMLPLVAATLAVATGCEALTFPIHRPDRNRDESADTAWWGDDEPWEPGVYVRYGYVGAAEVTPGESYLGWEEYVIQDVYSSQYMCRYTWVATGIPNDSCAECDWAFSVSMDQGTLSEGWCEGLTEQTGPWGYGFASAVMGTYDTYTDVMMMYYGGAYGWIPYRYAYYGDGTFAYQIVAYEYY